jgi:hypothetical protein
MDDRGVSEKKDACKVEASGSRVALDNLSGLQRETRTHGTPESRDSENSLSRESPGFFFYGANVTEMAKL